MLHFIGYSCAHTMPVPSSSSRWKSLLWVVSLWFSPVSRFGRDHLACCFTHIYYCVNPVIFTIRVRDHKWGADLHNLVSSALVGVNFAYLHCHSLTFPLQAFLFLSFFLSPWWPAPLRWKAWTASQFRFDCFFLDILSPLVVFIVYCNSLLITLLTSSRCGSCMLQGSQA